MEKVPKKGALAFVIGVGGLLIRSIVRKMIPPPPSANSLDPASDQTGWLFVVADAATLVADARHKGLLWNGLYL